MPVCTIFPLYLLIRKWLNEYKSIYTKPDPCPLITDDTNNNDNANINDHIMLML